MSRRSRKGAAKPRMECVRLKINEHMTSLGEEILCVLDKPQRGAESDDVCSVELNVRVFVLERLSAATKFVCDLFQREIEPLEALVETQRKLLDIDFGMDLELHTAGVMSQTSQTLVFCPECRFAFSSQAFLDRHIKRRHKDKPFRCSVCGKGFGHSCLLKRHMLIHTGEKPLCCQVCGKYFGRSDQLNRHMRSHTGGKSLRCNVPATDQKPEDQPVPYSHQQFTNTLTQPGEVKTQHTGEKPLRCNVSATDQKPGDTDQQPVPSTHQQLTKTLTQPGEVKKLHRGEKPCKVCGKCFTHSGDLNKHMRIHRGEKPFQCKVCGKCCTQAVHLKSHMRIHSGEELLRCNVSATDQNPGDQPVPYSHQQFTNTLTQPGEVKMHTGEKTFGCKVCGRCFSQTSHLNAHMRIHTGEKPFRCKVCDKCFGQSGNLNAHMRIHTREKPLRCKVSATDQKPGDTDQPVAHSHQQFTNTLTQPGEEKMHHAGEKTLRCSASATDQKQGDTDQPIPYSRGLHGSKIMDPNPNGPMEIAPGPDCTRPILQYDRTEPEWTPGIEHVQNPCFLPIASLAAAAAAAAARTSPGHSDVAYNPSQSKRIADSW